MMQCSKCGTYMVDARTVGGVWGGKMRDRNPIRTDDLITCPNCESNMNRGDVCPECPHRDQADCDCPTCSEKES